MITSNRLRLVALLLALARFDACSAATLVFYSASGDPAHNPDADHVTDVWQVESQGGARGTLVSDFDGNLDVWGLESGDQHGSITITHKFEGGALAVGQTVSVDFAHADDVADGERVGIRLMDQDGNAQLEFVLVGGDQTGFARADAAGTSPTGKGFDPNDLFNFSVTLTADNRYRAVATEGDIGGGSGAWSGDFTKPITAIQIFGKGGAQAEARGYFDNLIVTDASFHAVARRTNLPGREPSQKQPAAWDTPANEARVAALLKNMTLEEKVAQLAQFPWGNSTGPDGVRVDEAKLAASGGVGSFLNMTVGAKEINQVQRQAMEKSRLKIPILFALDVIHGYRTIYPIPLGLSASWDPQLAEACARVAAVEATSQGVKWNFSPMIDIAHDARWGRIAEGNGEDPYLGSLMAAAWVRGYQGDDLSAPTSMIACAKHFVAYGGAEGGRDYDRVDVSELTLRNTYLPPFQAAVDAGVGTLMSAFNTVAHVPASANRHTLTEILRDEWGFRGFVVSDWTAVAELIAHGVALDGRDAAHKALLAGVDMDMSSNLYAVHLPDLANKGSLDTDAIDEAVARILRLKVAAGLFENPYTDESQGDLVMLKPAHLEVARQAAEKSFVLLKNSRVHGKPLLPLAEDASVALIGQLADSQDDMLGSWSVRGKAEDHVTLKQSLATRLKDRLTYVPGVDPSSDDQSQFAEALAAAQRADVVIMALGERGRMSGEAESRAELDLPGKQQQLLEAVVATGKPVILVLFSGRPLALPWAAEHVPAILEVWFPGVQAGPALVRTLYGEVSPSGKLTASFPYSVGQMPLYYNTLNTGRPALGRPPHGGYITGYRDQYNVALFPFGWGLSYTSFDYSPTRVSRDIIRVSDLQQGETVQVAATVKNSGTRAGEEIVQLYIRERGTSIARPVRELKGFRKITLQPGETTHVQFSLGQQELAFWNLDAQHVVEPCELTVWIAPHSVGGHPATVMIEP